MNDDVPVSSRRQLRHTAAAVLGAVSLLALAACGSADPTPAATAAPAAFKPVAQKAGSEITVWADATRAARRRRRTRRRTRT